MTKLIFTGDVMIGRLINEYLLRVKDPSIIWGNTKDTFLDSDLNIINLECAITKNTNKGDKHSPVFFFRTEPQNINVLKEIRSDFCSLANNHILDFRVEGLLETLEILKKEGIAYSGAGKNIQEAIRPSTIKCRDTKIKIFSFTDNEVGWEADENKPGIFYLPIDIKNKKVKLFLNSIKKAKEKGFFVIVSSHWGPNMVRFPPQRHIEFAHCLIEAGCDIFHGHSSHVFQPVEIYQGKVIFYDCGEMIDDYAVDPILRNDESFIFEVFINDNNINKVVLKPIFIKNLQTNLVYGKTAKTICNKMIELCESFKTKTTFQKDRIIINPN